MVHDQNYMAHLVLEDRPAITRALWHLSTCAQSASMSVVLVHGAGGKSNLILGDLEAPPKSTSAIGCTKTQNGVTRQLSTFPWELRATTVDDIHPASPNMYSTTIVLGVSICKVMQAGLTSSTACLSCMAERTRSGQFHVPSDSVQLHRPCCLGNAQLTYLL